MLQTCYNVDYQSIKPKTLLPIFNSSSISKGSSSRILEKFSGNCHFAGCFYLNIFFQRIFTGFKLPVTLLHSTISKKRKVILIRVSACNNHVTPCYKNVFTVTSLLQTVTQLLHQLLHLLLHPFYYSNQ